MIVRESIVDILKPKDTDDIRKELKDIIFWKGVIEGKLSPVSIKYFIDQNFIKKRAEDLNIPSSISLTSRTNKILIYIYDLIRNKPNTNLSQSNIAAINDAIFKWLRQPNNAKYYLDLIKDEIEDEYRYINKKFKKVTGNDLR